MATGVATDEAWYRDAVIYELHVRAFKDANGDGVGDFAGLTQTLDYVASLGVTAIWLLPFYPSPLRDGGYDIADYTAVHPAYGTRAEFAAFVTEAHRRGLRVITELVLNHTSDRHPWFVESRASRESARRDWYVWSDTDHRYEEARIIFTDTETSNWAWDDQSRAWYWHRFFSHQPDLNWDSPAVYDAMLDVMRHWFDLGVDGMRLDAVPYLIERDGTNGENLPETHAILKRLRAAVDAEYPGRMLLAEANQWPADLLPYFGDGDEVHMAFHFPLMPRIWIALRSGERGPIVEVLEQTPPIPEGCRWAVFLRNHDELTLEMVSDEERAFLWSEYAPDPRMRLNIGIRRRLAPLADNSRARIELLNLLLLSLPGTPVLYYGDEIGMGDDVSLPDRDGVRTPMQWNAERNAGFSEADAGALYSPLITDPVYGYQAVNVAAQNAAPDSQLNWMRHLIATRQRFPVFGRGTFAFIKPPNEHVLAYLREHDGTSVAVVANLSGEQQGADLDLRRFAGAVPVDLVRGRSLPPVGADAYRLSLGPYECTWLLVADAG